MSTTNQFKTYTTGIIDDASKIIAFNHYVVVYGWGQTKEGVKYWLGQNSYGPVWGDQGSFKILRGKNTLNI